MEHILWHGTNQDFDAFDLRMLGLNTDNASSRRAFFFASDPAAASDYANFAARNLIPNQARHDEDIARLLAEADKATLKRNWDLQEKLLTEAERIEALALQADPAGACLLKCKIEIENPFQINLAGLGLLTNIDEIMDAARTDGFDAVVLLNILDTPTGAGPVCDHYAIFDPDRIEILERISCDVALSDAEEVGLAL